METMERVILIRLEGLEPERVGPVLDSDEPGRRGQVL
jgi:hypothetical protein